MARERYTKRRTVLAITGVLSFYITYVAYRNLKSYLPILAEQDLDRSLLEPRLPAALFYNLLLSARLPA